MAKTVDSEAVDQAIEANIDSSNRRVSGELGITQSCEGHYIHDLGKSIRRYQNIAKLLTHSSISNLSLFYQLDSVLFSHKRLNCLIIWWMSHNSEFIRRNTNHIYEV